MNFKYLITLTFLSLATTAVASPANATRVGSPIMVAGIFEGIGNLFDRKKAHLQELIDSHQYEDGEAFYNANKAALNQSRGIGTVLTTLSDKLNERYTAGADELISLLNGLASPAPAASWPYAVTSMKQVQTLTDKYNQFALLKEQAYRSPKIAQLAVAVDHANTALQDSAGAAFAVYDHTLADFFDKYPVELAKDKRQVIVEEHEDKWLPLIGSLNQDRSGQLIKAYASLLQSDKALDALGVAYEKAVMGWNGWKEPLEIDKVWSLSSRFQSAGIDPRHIPVRRAIIVLTGARPGPVPAGWDADVSAYGLPYLVGSGAELSQQIGQLSAAGVQYFVIIDPSRVIRINTLSHPISATGSRITGTQQQINPEYTRAKQAVEDATADYNSAMQEKTASAGQTQVNTSGGLGSLGSAVMGVVASTSASMSATAAQNKLTAARATLAGTPMNVTENITEPYTYTTATAEHLTEQQVGVYFLDTRNGLVYRSKLEASVSESDKLYSKVDPRDPQKEELDGKTKQALAKFERPVDVVVEPAEKILPDILTNPITGSKRQAADLAQIISDDQAIFQHKSAEKQHVALEESKRQAPLIGVDIDFRQAAGDLGVLLFPPVPDDMGCNELASVRGSAQLPELWKAALDKVTKRNGDQVQSSYVFMEVRDDISNLREEIARHTNSGDAAGGVEATLAALKSTATALDSLMNMAADPMIKKTYAGLDDYFSERMKIGAYNMVAVKAREARPEIVASLYTIYHHAYNERSTIDDARREAFFNDIDARLDQLGKQLSSDDEQLSGLLNTVAGSKATEEVNATIDVKCGVKPTPTMSTASLVVATPPTPTVVPVTASVTGITPTGAAPATAPMKIPPGAPDQANANR
jgi:hypothetical protein